MEGREKHTWASCLGKKTPKQAHIKWEVAIPGNCLSWKSLAQCWCCDFHRQPVSFGRRHEMVGWVPISSCSVLVRRAAFIHCWEGAGSIPGPKHAQTWNCNGNPRPLHPLKRGKTSRQGEILGAAKARHWGTVRVEHPSCPPIHGGMVHEKSSHRVQLSDGDIPPQSTMHFSFLIPHSTFHISNFMIVTSRRGGVSDSDDMLPLSG